MPKIHFIIFFFIAIPQLHAANLPAIYTDDATEFLQEFPLNKTTITDIMSIYGQPQIQIEGSDEDNEIWTIYKMSTVYIFYSENGVIYDVTISTGNLKPKNTIGARELQSVH